MHGLGGAGRMLTGNPVQGLWIPPNGPETPPCSTESRLLVPVLFLVAAKSDLRVLLLCKKDSVWLWGLRTRRRYANIRNTEHAPDEKQDGEGACPVVKLSKL